MVNTLTETSFNEMPAVVCTAGSYIARTNHALHDKSGRCAEGKLLYDSMSPPDILRFDARFASCENLSTFSFPLRGQGRYKGATAVFTTVLGHRFAVVFFERQGDLSVEAMMNAMTEDDRKRFSYAIVKNILGIPEIPYDSEEKRGLTDIKAVTRTALSNLSCLNRFSDYEISMSENTEMEKSAYMPCSLPMSAYLQIIIQLMFALCEISSSRRADVKLCKYGMQSEVRATTEISDSVGAGDIDALMRLYPGAATYLSICRYVAGVFESTLTSVYDAGTGSLTLVLSVGEAAYEDTDFKSRDRLSYFDEAFSFALRYTELLSSGDAEEQ